MKQDREECRQLIIYKKADKQLVGTQLHTLEIVSIITHRLWKSATMSLRSEILEEPSRRM